jgi:ATP-dependent Clp protease protease subunit
MRKRNKQKDVEMSSGGTIHQEGPFINILNKNQHLLLFSEIDEESAIITVAKIRALNETKTKHPIIIEICSPGGDVGSGIAIINAIRSSRIPIVTLINGEACSMAALISMCGHERYMYKNSFWMLHPVQDFIHDYSNFIKDRAAYLSKLEKTVDLLVREHTKLSEVDIKKATTGELWFDAEQCLARAIVDKLAE